MKKSVVRLLCGVLAAVIVGLAVPGIVYAQEDACDEPYYYITPHNLFPVRKPGK